ncbi:MAG: hypothetical protein J6X28_05090 [Bacilli bacterium]|nr:hypothetical protein [Bacilli bacterium]
MRRTRKKSLLLGILLLVMGLGLGYAFITTTLNIEGTTDVDSNTWNVYWDNVQVTTGSVAATTPSISNQTTVSFTVHLTEPGQFYEFKVDAKNDGTIDAMIDTITKTINNSTEVPAYLKYEVTYEDGLEIEQYQYLKINEKETIKIRVEYRDDIDPSLLPSTPQALSISFGLSYVQADANAVKVRNWVYAFNETRTYIGDDVSKLGYTTDSVTQCISHFGKHYFSKHIIKDNKVVYSELGFVIYNYAILNEYSIIGGDGGASFERNKQLILSLAGESNCHSTTYDGYNCTNFQSQLYSSNSDIVGGIAVYPSGSTTVGNNYSCYQYQDGSTRCYYD